MLLDHRVKHNGKYPSKSLWIFKLAHLSVMRTRAALMKPTTAITLGFMRITDCPLLQWMLELLTNEQQLLIIALTLGALCYLILAHFQHSNFKTICCIYICRIFLYAWNASLLVCLHQCFLTGGDTPPHGASIDFQGGTNPYALCNVKSLIHNLFQAFGTKDNY